MQAFQTNAREVIFIGLPGPTHNYGGLAAGNVASERNAGDTSRPREALLQALLLAEQLLQLGIPVAVLPPQLRPHLPALRAAGFDGTPADIIARAAEQNPQLLARVYSSAAMWTANAATVSPSWDSGDGCLHVTPANLITHAHRALEAENTYLVLKQIFHGEKMHVHLPLLAEHALADEGAANHTRLTPSHGHCGLHVFVYGRNRDTIAPKKFPARQTLEASQLIARHHDLDPEKCLFIQQNPDAIDAGVFHNDVIAVGNESLLLVHEQAFAGGMKDIQHISTHYHKQFEQPLTVAMITDNELTVEEAIATYFFNSQLVTLDSGAMALIAPVEVREHARAHVLMERLRSDAANPIAEVHYLDLRQSMKNGGGPACLRLRVPMREDEMQAVRAQCNVFLDTALLTQLRDWAQKHYREEIRVADLANVALYDECSNALLALGKLLRLKLIETIA